MASRLSAAGEWLAEVVDGGGAEEAVRVGSSGADRPPAEGHGSQVANVPYLRLLHLIDSLRPLMVPIGISRRGNPVVLNLARETTHHLWLANAGVALQGEVLRTLMLGLALTGRPSDVQVAAIDLSGAELTVLGGLPHGLTDLATDLRFASEVLDWLIEEAQRREHAGVQRPAIVVLAMPGHRGADLERLQSRLAVLIRASAGVGIHILGAGPADLLGRPPGMVLAKPSAAVRSIGGNWLRLETDRRVAEVNLIRLSVHELEVAVSLASAGWRTPAAIGRR